jgi:hypothetical protein
VGGADEVDRGGRRDLPGGTFGVTGGGADASAGMRRAVRWKELANAPGETALAGFAELDTRFDLPISAKGALEASSRGGASRVTTQATSVRFRTGVDWSIFAPVLFPRVQVACRDLGGEYMWGE